MGLVHSDFLTRLFALLRGLEVLDVCGLASRNSRDDILAILPRMEKLRILAMPKGVRCSLDALPLKFPELSSLSVSVPCPLGQPGTALVQGNFVGGSSASPQGGPVSLSTLKLTELLTDEHAPLLMPLGARLRCLELFFFGAEAAMARLLQALPELRQLRLNFTNYRPAVGAPAGDDGRPAPTLREALAAQFHLESLSLYLTGVKPLEMANLLAFICTDMPHLREAELASDTGLTFEGHISGQPAHMLESLRLPLCRLTELTVDAMPRLQRLLVASEVRMKELAVICCPSLQELAVTGTLRSVRLVGCTGLTLLSLPDTTALVPVADTFFRRMWSLSGNASLLGACHVPSLKEASLYMRPSSSAECVTFDALAAATTLTNVRLTVDLKNHLACQLAVTLAPAARHVELVALLRTARSPFALVKLVAPGAAYVGLMTSLCPARLELHCSALTALRCALATENPSWTGHALRAALLASGLADQLRVLHLVGRCHFGEAAMTAMHDMSAFPSLRTLVLHSYGAVPGSLIVRSRSLRELMLQNTGALERVEVHCPALEAGRGDLSPPHTWQFMCDCPYVRLLSFQYHLFHACRALQLGDADKRPVDGSGRRPSE